jgi:hypothetical protein
MFDQRRHIGVEKVSVKVKNDNGRILRTCRITLSHEFDDDIAAALGRDAGKAMEGLASGAYEQVVIPIDSLKVSAVFNTLDRKDRVELPVMLGLKAKATAATNPMGEEVPKIALEFEFVFNDHVWLFLGQHCGESIEITLSKRQLELAS